MELPDDIIYIIKQYSKSRTCPDWRKGSYLNRCDDDFNYQLRYYVYYLDKFFIKFPRNQ